MKVYRNVQELSPGVSGGYRQPAKGAEVKIKWEVRLSGAEVTQALRAFVESRTVDMAFGLRRQVDDDNVEVVVVKQRDDRAAEESKAPGLSVPESPTVTNTWDGRQYPEGIAINLSWTVSDTEDK